MRHDQMPEGHPEKRPQPIATLTLYATPTGDQDDDGTPDHHIHGEMRVSGHVHSDDEAGEVFEVLRGMFEKVLNSRSSTIVVPVPACSCGNHDGGDDR